MVGCLCQRPRPWGPPGLGAGRRFSADLCVMGSLWPPFLQDSSCLQAGGGAPAHLRSFLGRPSRTDSFIFRYLPRCLSCVHSTLEASQQRWLGAVVCRAPPPLEGILPGTSAWVWGPQTDPAEPSDLRSQAGSPVTQSGQPRSRASSHVALGNFPSKE